MPTMLARISPSTFQLQETLPRLPVPRLQDTLERYLRSLEPVPVSYTHLTLPTKA